MSNTTIGNGSGTYTISPGSNGTVTVGNGNDTIDINGGSQDKITIGTGNDAVTVTDATKDTVSVGSGIDTVTLTGGSQNAVTVGNDNDTVNAATEQYDTINAGSGNDTITAGANSNISVGNGTDTITAGANSNITAADCGSGTGADTITTGTGSTVRGGDGNDKITAGGGSTITDGNGNDTVTVNGGTGTSITLGNGNDTVTVTGSSANSITVGSGNSVINVSGDTGDTIIAGNGTNTIIAGANSTITTGDGILTFELCGLALTIAIGCGSEAITAGADSIISVGDGNDTITTGAGSVITAGDGTDTIVAGSGSTITAGIATDSLSILGFTLASLTVANGNDTINAGANSTIVAGDGNDTIVAGANSNVTVGTASNSFTFLGCTIDVPGCDGAVTVTAGAHSIITVGNGNATVNMGASNIVTIGTGNDLLTLPMGAGTSLTAPPSLTVVEDHSIAIAISASVSGAGFGAETIYGFGSNDELQLSTTQFANFAAVLADAKQVGSNTVITLDASDAITLENVKLSSLQSKNFTFVSGGGSSSNVTVTVTGVPSGATLSSTVDPSGVTFNSSTNTWTVASAALSGLTLNAGGITTATLTVTATNATNGTSVSQNITLTVDQAAPVFGGATSDAVTESGGVTLGATVTKAFSDDTLGNVTITGLPNNLTAFNGGTYTASSGTWIGSAAQFNALSFTAGGVGTSTLAISATTTGTDAGAAATENYVLTVDQAKPVFGGATADTVIEDGAVTLGATDTKALSDDTLGNVTITGLPTNLTGFNGGTYTASTGTWTGSAVQFNALSFTAGGVGTSTLSISATTTGTDAGAAATESYVLTVDQAKPIFGGATSDTVTEDGSVTLGAIDTKAFSDDTLGNVTITGLPTNLTGFNGGSYTASSGTWTGSAAQFNALTFTAGGVGTSTLLISATTTGTDAGAAATESYTLTVDQARPVLGGATADTVTEHGAVTLGATDTAAFSDDMLGNVTITGLPTGLTGFNGGTYTSATGTWTGTAAQFSALLFTAGAVGTLTLSISANTAGTDSGAPATESYTLTVDQARPVLGGATADTVTEHGAVTLGATDTAAFSDDTLGNVTITGLPTGLTGFNGGTYTVSSGTWTGTAAQFSALSFTAGGIGTYSLSIAATTTGTNPGAPATETYTLTVDQARPVLGGATSTTVNEDGAVRLGATDTAAFSDDTLGNVTITGLPTGLTGFNGGTYTSATGTWTGTAAQFSALSFTAGEVGTYALSISATTMGTDPGAPATEGYTLAVDPVAPTLTAPTSLSVNTGGTVALDIGETPFDPRDTVSITITGVPTDATLSAGTNNGGGSWTLTSAQLASLTLTAGQTTTANLVVTATNTQGATASTSDSIALTVNPILAVSISTLSNDPSVQQGQILYTQASITGDAADQAATISYQWQTSTDGGLIWTDVPATTTGTVNNELSSLYQLEAANDGSIFRVQASFTDDAGNVITATSAPTSPVADITPILTVPFSYAVDDFSIATGNGATFSDNFSSGPPPVGGLFGTTLDAFGTSAGPGGSTWTEGVNNLGQPAAIMSSSGAAINSNNVSVQAFLVTNTSPEGTGTGESNKGLKENETFTVSGTFDLTTPAPGTGYGIVLYNAAPGVNATEEVQLEVVSTPGGGANVILFQTDPATATFTAVGSLSLTAAQLADNTQIELSLVHGTANTTTVTGSFALLDDGTQTFSDTFAATPHVFDGQTYTRAEIQTFSNDGVTILGTAEEGQTLTANTVTNDVNATISYQWEESTSAAFTTFTDIGTNSPTYAVQESDENDYIRVVATATDSGSGQSYTATSAPTGPVIDDASISVAIDVLGIGNAAVQAGQILVTSATITGDPSDLTAPVSYQWQTSTDGGLTWTDVAASTEGVFNNELSSFYQLQQTNVGSIFRVQASFTDDTGQVVTASSTPTVAVAEVTPTLTAPFSYALDSLTIVDGDGATMDDTFNQGPPPAAALFGGVPYAFSTGGGYWTEVDGKAVMSASNVAPNAVTATIDSILGTYLTNTQPEGTGAGESDSGLKEDQTFTVSATFDLTVPASGGNYGVELVNNATGGPSPTEVVQIIVHSTNSGGAFVTLNQANLAAGTSTALASLTLTAAQLADNTQIELDLAHNTANTTTITGSFELYDNGSETFADTFSTTGHEFNNQTFTRASVFLSAPIDDVLLTGTAQEGQTLTANTVTNDPDAVINYQWEESTSSTFTSFTDIGTNSATYAVQKSDENDYIRVVATATDVNDGQSTTATSAPTGPVIDDASISVALTVSGNGIAQAGQVLVGTGTISGDPSDLTAPVTYQWQSSSDGGVTWTDVPQTTIDATSSIYQLGQPDIGDIFRVQASFTDDTGQVVTGTSNSTAAVVQVTPILATPFSYTVDEFKVVKGNGLTLDDTFTNGPPPVAGTFTGPGGTADAFSPGGAGSVWTEGVDNLGQPAAIMASTGMSFNGLDDSIQAFLFSNQLPEGTGPGESDSGYKEDGTFTVSSTFDLVAPLSSTSYGIVMGNFSSNRANETEVVQLLVQGLGNGGTSVVVNQVDYATNTFTQLASYTLSAAQLADNTQIELDLAHNTPNTPTITATFELIDNGTQTLGDTLSTAAHVFDNQTNTTVGMEAISQNYVSILGTAQEGQTLTASTSTNDPNATISYQWEESTTPSFSTFADIGTNSATYAVLASDENDYIRVVATATDPNTGQSTTATSAPTGPVIDDATLSVSTSVLGLAGSPVQVAQTLITDATVTGDPSDLTAPITYQWQISSDGVNWTDVPASASSQFATVNGSYNPQVSSFYQLTQAELGDYVRVQASLTDDTGQVITATSTPTPAAAEVTPILSVPFSYAVDDFSVTDGLGESFNDNFSAGPPPAGGTFGSELVAFQTSSQGRGTTWTEGVNNLGQPAAIMSATNANYNGTDDSVQAILLTNNQADGTGAGESESGLKEDDTFTVSGTFDLVTPQPGTSYGIELNETASTGPVGGTLQQVQIQVYGLANGGAQVDFNQRNPSTGTITSLGAYTLSAAQLAGNTQIELDLSHNTANSTAIAGSFELFDAGAQTFSDTFAKTGDGFDYSTAVRALIQGIAGPGYNITILGKAQEGQTLTANTVTNDPDAVISYQWEESTSAAFTSFTDIGANSSTYAVQESDENDYIRVVATATDVNDGQSATATSAPTGPVIDNASISVAIDVLGNDPVQQGQTLYTQATITGDPSDLTAPVTYQWQTSSDGGLTWTDVVATTMGTVNSILSSLYQLEVGDIGNMFRVQASFTDDTGQVVTATSAPTVPVVDITPVLTVPFSYTVDDFSITTGNGASFNDNFSSGPPPVGGLFGTTLDAFSPTSGPGGSTWTEGTNNLGQPAAIMSSSGAAINDLNSSVQAILITNTSPEGTGAGESNKGLKENGTFTVGGTFDLTTPQPGTGYGITLLNGTPGVETTEEVQLQVVSTPGGGASVNLFQSDPATDTFTTVGSLTLTAAQLADNTQIELSLAHNTANATTVTGSFELLDDGAETFSDTFSATPHVFAGQTYTRAEIQTFSNDGVTILGTAQEGQTLTANTVTNDINATISYQWEESTSSAFTTFTDIGGNSPTYAVQESDENAYIRVVATANDVNSGQSATATSAPTGPVIDDATLSVSTSIIGNPGSVMQVGQTLVTFATITGDPSDLTAPVTYQWQTSSDGGLTWTDVPATTSFSYNNELSSVYQLQQADLGNIFRVEASLTDDTGQVITATSTPTVPVAPVTPILSVPFSYTVDSYTYTNGLGASFDDNFANGPPPVGGVGLVGSPPVGFQTSAGGYGSIWTEGLNNLGQPAAIMSSTGAAFNTIDRSVNALLLTSPQPEGTGPGESNSGLKENDTFTIGATFDLVAPQVGTNYGIALVNAASGPTAEEVQLQLTWDGQGGAIIALNQSDPAADVFTRIASYDLTAQQLTGNTQIELDLAHNTINSSTITSSFELYDDGTQTFADTLTPSTPAHLFNTSTEARGYIQGIDDPGYNITILGTAQEGQTLTANTSTNDPDATINYQWQESTDSSFSTFTDVGVNSPTYAVQPSDAGSYIRVVASTSDPNNPQSATAASAAELVLPVAPSLSAYNVSVNEDGSVALPVSVTPFDPNDPVDVTISGIPSDVMMTDGDGDVFAGGGTFTLSLAQLDSGVTLNAGAAETATMTVTATNEAGPTASNSIDFSLTVNPVAPTISISAASISVNEDGTVALPISVTPFDPRDPVMVTIGGIPSGGTLTDGDGDTFAGGGLPATLTLAQLDSGVTLTVGPQIPATPIEMTVQATNNGGSGASAPEQFLAVTVDPVAPSLSAPTTLTVNEDGSIALPVTVTPFDPSDNVQVTIAGIPSDATLTDGDGDVFSGGGSYTLSLAQVDSGLTLNAGEVTAANLTITATNDGGPAPDQMASTSQSVALTVNPVAPTLTAPSSLSVNSGGTVALDISETPFDPRDTVSITITGVPLDAMLSAGTNNGGGSWTLTPSQLSGLTLNAGQATVTTLAVTATNSEGATASTADNIALTINPVLTLGVSVVDNLPAQDGQTLVATATISGDSADAGATINYQWQSSSDGGLTWTTVGGALAGNYDSGQASSFLQLTAADEGLQFRAQASFTDSDGNLISTTSGPTVAVADVTPEITVPFSYTVSDLSIVKNGTEIYNDTFSQAPPGSPTILSSGVPTPIEYLTLGGTWTESGGQAVISSAGVAPNPAVPGSVEDFALLNTNTQSASTGGLKEGAAFTVSSTFGLSVPPTGNYGMELNDGTDINGTNQLVRLIVTKSSGNTVVELVQGNLTTNPITMNVLASQVLTTAELADNNQIEFQLSHVANTTAISASFELIDSGTVTTTVNFAPTATIFTGGVDWTRVDIGAFTNPGVGLSVAGGQSPLEGQTLTASAATNDSNAPINYQWEESATASFTTFSDIGTNSPTYVVQESDVGSYIRVVASTFDPNSPAGEQSATVTSAVTGLVLPEAPSLSAPTTLSVNEDGTIPLDISETPFSPNDPVSITIGGVPSDATLSAGTNNGSGGWTLTPSQLAGLTLTAGEATTTNLVVTATNTAGTMASTTDTIGLTVDAVAPTISLSSSAISVNEDGTVALPISVTAFDARDPVTVTIGGIPSGGELTVADDGTFAGGGLPATLTLAQLDSGVTLTVGPQIPATPIEMTVQATNAGASAPLQFLAVTVDPVAPALSAPTTLTVNEDGSISLPLAVTPFDPSDNIQVSIAGLPADALLADGDGDTFTGGGTYLLSLAQVDSGLTLTAGEVTTANLTVTATNDGGPAPDQKASIGQSIALTVDPVAPVLGGTTAASVTAGSVVTLGATDTAAYSDDTLGNVTITGLPSGLSGFSGGTYTGSSGTWTGTAAQFNALSFTAGATGSFNLSISATTIGAPAPTTENYALAVNQPAAATGYYSDSATSQQTLGLTAAISVAAGGQAQITGLVDYGQPSLQHVNIVYLVDGEADATPTYFEKELQGYEALTQALVADGVGSITDVTIINYASTVINEGTFALGTGTTINNVLANLPFLDGNDDVKDALTAVQTGLSADPAGANIIYVADSNVNGSNPKIAQDPASVVSTLEAAGDLINVFGGWGPGGVSVGDAGEFPNANIVQVTNAANLGAAMSQSALAATGLSSLDLSVDGQAPTSLSVTATPLGLSFTATANVSTNDASVQTITVTATGSDSAATTASVAAATVNEGGTVTLGATAAATFSNHTIAKVTITGLPSDLTHFSGGTYTAAAGTWTGTAAQFDALSFTAGEAGAHTLSLSATTTGGAAVPTTENYTLTVGLAPPVLGGATSDTVTEGGSVTLGVTDTKAFSDDTLGNVTITGLPTNLSGFSGGIYTAASGTWTGTAAQFNALSFTTGGAGTSTLSISATTTGAVDATTENYMLTVDPAAPALSAPAMLSVNEAAAVALGITETPAEPTDPVSITIAGVPAGSSLSAGTNNGGGNWTLTPAQLAGLTLDAGERTAVTTYSYGPSLDFPSGTNTEAEGVNDEGQIVGSYVAGPGSHGFLLSNGTYTSIDDPNNSYSTSNGGTIAYGINDSGEIVGQYADSSSHVNGFLLDNGTYTTINDPAPNNGTVAVGINNAGQIVGWYADASDTQHGFVDTNGSFTTITDPLATTGSFLGTNATGINDEGEVVGYYTDSAGFTHGFLDVGGSFTTLNDPLAVAADESTIALGINNAGQVVGFYFDNVGLHGFLYSNGVYATLDDPSAVILSGGFEIGTGTIATAINNNGQFVGAVYTGSSGNHGYLATPQTTLTVTATNTEGAGASTSVTTALTIDTAPPVLGGAISVSITEGGTVTFDATDTASESDDTLGNVTITGLPTTLSGFNGGTYTSSSGTWTGTAAQFNALSFTTGAAGTSTLSISATTYGADAPSTETYTLTVQQPVYSFTTLSDPSATTLTEPFAINGSGEVVGYYRTPGSHAFLYDNGAYTTLESGTAEATGINDSGEIVGLLLGNGSFLYNNGTYITLNDPSAPDGVDAVAINDSGQIAGNYENASDVTEGFLDSNGTFTALSDPSATLGTDVVAINDAGQVAGYYYTAGLESHGFIYSNGVYTTLNDPSADTANGTSAQAINDSGEVVGSYVNSGGIHGFTYSNGTYTTLDDPLAVGRTVATAVNDSGEVAGYYQDASGNEHGFVYDNGTYTTVQPPGATQSELLAINNSGQVAGYYIENGVTYGFIATDPVTIAAGENFQINAPSADAVTFAGNSGELQLGQSQSFAGTVAGFGGQDQIDLGDIAAGANATLGYAANSGNTGGTLTVSDGTNTANLALLGQYTAASFAVASDGHGGTMITEPAAVAQNQLTQPHG
jgi:probable HAF family extracellular repeat protein